MLLLPYQNGALDISVQWAGEIPGVIRHASAYNDICNFINISIKLDDNDCLHCVREQKGEQNTVVYVWLLISEIGRLFTMYTTVSQIAETCLQ